MDDQIRALGQQQIEREARMVQSGFDPSTLPTLSTNAPEAANHGLVYNALHTGWNEAQGVTDQAVAAGLKLAGANKASADWTKSAAEQDAEAARYRMNELEIAPWREGGSWANLPQQAVYQALKQAPNVAAGLLGGAVATAAAPEAFAGTAAAAGAGRLMGMLGGEATAEAGAAALRQGVGAAATAYPQAVGSMYGEAVERGNPDASDAGKAMIMGVPYAALEAVEPTQLRGIFSKVGEHVAEKGLAGGIRATLADGAKALVNEAATEGAQTAMEQTFRPDLTLGQKANNIVDAMFMGGIAGGVLGSATSGAGHTLRALNTQPASTISNDPATMVAAVDNTIQPQQQVANAPAPPIANDSVNVNPSPDVATPEAISAAAPNVPPNTANSEEAPTYNPARPYQILSDEQLAQRVQEVEPGSPQLTAISNEIAARQQERAAASTAQPQQLETDKLNDQKAFAEKLRQDAGLTKQADKTIQRMGVTDEASAFDAVSAAMEGNKAPTKTLQKLAEYFGVNPDGTQRDVASELAVAKDAQTMAATSQQKAAATAHVAELERIQAVHDQVAQRRTEAAQAAQAQEEARQADAQLSMAQAITAKPLQSAAQEETAGLPKAEKSAFMAGVRAFNAGQEAPTRKGASAGYEFAQKYREAQNLVENANVQTSNAVEQPTQTVGVDVGLGQGDAASPTQQQNGAIGGLQQQVDASGSPIQGQAFNSAGQEQNGSFQEQNAALQGQNAVPAQGQGQQQSSAQQGQGTIPVQGQISPAAEELLASVDAGGVPGVLTNRLRNIARENGITIEPTTTPDAVVAQLRTMRDGAASQGQTSSVPDNVVPGPRPSVSAQQAAATTATASAPETRSAPRSAPSTAQAVGQQVRNATQTVAAVERATEKIPATPSTPGAPKTSTRGEQFLRAHLGWTTMFHIAQHYAKQMPQLMKFVEAQQTRQNISQRWSSVAMQAWYTLEKLPQAVQDKVGEVMAVSTELRVDPEKSWADHTHITNDSSLSAARKEELKQVWEDLRKEFRSLQGSGGAKAYQQFRQINEADRHAHHAVALARLLQTEPSVAANIRTQAGDPMLEFLSQSNANDSPESVNAFWKKKADKLASIAQQEMTRQKAELNNLKLSPEEKAQRGQDRALIEGVLKQIGAERTHMQEAPYFHLGRFGNYAVSFKITQLSDGSLEAANVDRIRDRLRGLSDGVINPRNGKPEVFVRVDTADKMNQLRAAADEMAAKGWIKDVAQRNLEQEGPVMSRNGEKLMQRMIEEVRASGLWDTGDPEVAAQREKMEKFIRQFAIDTLPDMSIGRVLTERKNVSGYSKDMLRAFATRVEQGGMSLARQSGTAKIMDVLGEMRQAVKQAENVGGDSTLLSNLYNEAVKREYLRSMSSGNSFMETMKALNYTYFMGFNPSHAALQFMQVPVLLLPELAKRANVGFMKASKAIAGATTPAFKIMAAVVQQGAEQGLSRAASAVITPQALEKALPGEANRAKRDFLMRVVNSGAIDTGSESREFGRAAAGKINDKLDKYTRYANALGYYAETTSRLIAALATYETSKGDAEAKFHDAVATVDQAMFNFANYNTSRNMGRNGFLGPATPLVTAFMSYNAQLMEKLYRETYKALGAGDTNSAEAAEARKFLLYHAGAVVSVAGVMGLPFATAFAVAFDKLKDWTDPEDEPFDSRAAFRNWMDLTFGHTVGDVLARGLPRLTGSDVSDRAGEANLLPFSQLLADRGSWRDAFGRLEQRGFGSPAAAMQNILGAVDQFDAGDYFGASRAFMPQGIKNMMDAYKMGEDGYVDARGQKLPLSVEAEDQLRKAIGFKGDRETDYSEVKQINDREKRTLQQEAGPIMKNLVNALKSGDMDAARDYFGQAQTFDAQHPTQAILPKLMSRFKSSVKNEAVESATGMPVGIKMENQHLMDNLQWYQGRAR